MSISGYQRKQLAAVQRLRVARQGNLVLSLSYILSRLTRGSRGGLSALPQGGEAMYLTGTLTVSLFTLPP